MNMRFRAAVIAATLLGSTLLVFAQERKERAVYKVEFDIQNGSGGEAQPSQHFAMLVDESRKGLLQAVSRVPAYTGSSEYVDVGANIECTVHESEDKATLSANIELSDITGRIDLSALSEPIIVQRRAVFDATVELGTRTLVMDGRNAALQRTTSPEAGIKAHPTVAASMHQVEATVTKVN